MAGRGTARIQRGGSGPGHRYTASLFSTRVVRLGPPANDNARRYAWVWRSLMGVAALGILASAFLLLA
jgi:hypothetical protein